MWTFFVFVDFFLYSQKIFSCCAATSSVALAPPALQASPTGTWWWPALSSKSRVYFWCTIGLAAPNQLWIQGHVTVIGNRDASTCWRQLRNVRSSVAVWNRSEICRLSFDLLPVTMCTTEVKESSDWMGRDLLGPVVPSRTGRCGASQVEVSHQTSFTFASFILRRFYTTLIGKQLKEASAETFVLELKISPKNRFNASNENNTKL